MSARALLVIGSLWRTVLPAQSADPYEAASRVMEASLEKQRASVRRQVQTPRRGEESFFTVPWITGTTQGTLRVQPDTEECEPLPAAEVAVVVGEVAQQVGLTPDLLRAIIQKESDFRPCAVSRKGASGLMQLMPATALEMGVLDVFNPRQNISAGARFLKQLLEKYGGDLKLALAAYNAGPSNVDEAGSLPPFPETLDYVASIQQLLREK